MITGCFTALITPFKDDRVDYEGLDKLVEFQIQAGVGGILAVGTTGESPTLSWDEHNKVIEAAAQKTRNKCICIAGTGSNNTAEALAASGHARNAGAEAVLLVDPYYNGPSSLEIRREYVGPVAAAYPDLEVIPYVIPGRTGCQLLPEDLALLNREFKNVATVKEATANLDNMRRTRACCGADFTILSGDDGMTFEMMTDPQIRAAGVISVVTNVIPAAVAQMVGLLQEGNVDAARRLKARIDPLFSLVTVKTTETTAVGDVVCRARNPLAIKTLMQVLGMPSGRCRRPLGRMTRKGLESVLAAARRVQAADRDIFAPLADFFGIDIDARLNDPVGWEGLCYPEY